MAEQPGGDQIGTDLSADDHRGGRSHPARDHRD
jgi:hypothetical protein